MELLYAVYTADDEWARRWDIAGSKIGRVA
jgi:hypothetical protein